MPDQPALKRGNGPEHRQQQLTMGRRGVDHRIAERLEADAPRLQILEHRQEIKGRARKPINLRDHDHVALADLAEQGLQLLAVAGRLAGIFLGKDLLAARRVQLVGLPVQVL